MAPSRPPTRPDATATELAVAAFPVREAMLVVFAVVILVAVLAMALMAYRPSHVRAKVNNEAMFLNAAASQIRALLPMSNYHGVDVLWDRAVAKPEPWAQSPNGWHWRIQPATVEGTFPRACVKGRCSHLWFQLDYRDAEAMSEAECAKLLMVLNTDFDVMMIAQGSLTDELALTYCDREKLAPHPFLYAVTR